MSRPRLARLLVAALVAACAGGCGSNPPCNVTPAQVDDARAHAKATEAKLDIALDEKEKLQAQLDELEARIREQEELKRRSGGGAK